MSLRRACYRREHFLAQTTRGRPDPILWLRRRQEHGETRSATRHENAPRGLVSPGARHWGRSSAGYACGVTGAVGADAGLVPRGLVAVTVNV